MHAIDLANLANTMVCLTPAQLANRIAPNPASTQDYWLAARYRHENWMHELARHRDDIQRPGTSRRIRLWTNVLPIMQEVLLAESLARTLAYYGTLLEEATICVEFVSVANSVLAAHIEARQRCLHLIVFGQGLSVENAVRLNRLRRKMERYTDQLLALLPPTRNPGMYCFEVEFFSRCHTQIRNSERTTAGVTLPTRLLSEQLWHMTNCDIDWRCGNARLNYQLSQHVLGLLPATSFDSFGVPHRCSWGRLRNQSPEGATDHPSLSPFNFPKPPNSRIRIDAR